jgi:hypothetical protein
MAPAFRSRPTQAADCHYAGTGSSASRRAKRPSAEIASNWTPLADGAAILRLVFIIVATPASGRVVVPDVIETRPPGDAQIGKNIVSIQCLDGRIGLAYIGRPAGGQLAVVLRTERCHRGRPQTMPSLNRSMGHFAGNV